MENNMNQNGITPEVLAQALKLLLQGAAGTDGAAGGGDEPKVLRPLVKLCDPKGLRVIRGDSVDMDTLETGDPKVKCYYRSLLEVQESPHFMPVMLEIDHSAFDWYCGYSELDYVIEGTLELTIDGRRYTVRPGDVSYIPMRSTVRFSSPDHCKVFAVVYPTNWGDYC